MNMKMFALAFVLAAAPALAQPTRQDPVIVTSGQGVVRRAPDRAWVTIAAESRARTAAEAQKSNTDSMTAVLDKIKALGLSGDAIQTTGYTLQPEFEYRNGRQNVIGYIARNQVEVRVDALPKLGDVLANAVVSGATNVSGVRFDLKDRETAEAEALRLAVRDARRRADAAAGGAGVKIVQIMRVDEQREYDNIRPMPMAARAAGGEMPGIQIAVPVEGGQIEIRSHVTLTVRIE